MPCWVKGALATLVFLLVLTPGPDEQGSRLARADDPVPRWYVWLQSRRRRR